jgi:hypothetical protein
MKITRKVDSETLYYWLEKVLVTHGKETVVAGQWEVPEWAQKRLKEFPFQ